MRFLILSLARSLWFTCKQVNVCLRSPLGVQAYLILSERKARGSSAFRLIFIKLRFRGTVNIREHYEDFDCYIRKEDIKRGF